ncbi:hypothetical protein Cgig2_005510 [Carnegiea gigantea]|uniref:Uncharacterized protein n=1 Tax=Carnegiea gigantea TaxID=171969 RepID=A0A9Q1JE59_9CARY|nr:hypothetical protein Cgig2_005510 [Carnegiea gigantea]
MFGHEEGHCKKKEGTKTVWRPICNVPSPQEQGTNTQHTEHCEALPSNEQGTQIRQDEQNTRPRYTPLIHCAVLKVSTLDKFFITFVYGFNPAQQRHALWSDLQGIAAYMIEAWCVLGDFNAILHIEGRMGGAEVTDFKIRNFADCVFNCQLQKIRKTGAYYSWTNKTIQT